MPESLKIIIGNKAFDIDDINAGVLVKRSLVEEKLTDNIAWMGSLLIILL